MRLATPRVNFRFDANQHEYLDLDAGEVLPHTTGMLEQCGWCDDRWYTEQSCERGSAVHRLTADYDLEALDPATCVSRYRGYLMGHVQASAILQPTWTHVEVPLVSSRFRYGSRPDRVGSALLWSGATGILEIKSGAVEPAHAIQTALQAILLEEWIHLPAEHILRYALYLKPEGKYQLFAHDNRRDFDEARRIIRRCCTY